MTAALLKYRDILTEVPAPKTMFGGRVKLVKGKTVGGIVDVSTGLTIRGTGVDVVTGESGWSDNIVTNGGLDGIADNSFQSRTTYCHCGTGTATEAATDTALGTFVASTNDITSSTDAAESTAPYYGKNTQVYRFAEGAAEGNIAEIGFSNQASTGNLFSRARVKDGGGTPTTITVLADEWLDVYYEFRLYPDHILSGGGADDGTGTITISGVSYDYTIRPARVTNQTYYRALFARASFALISNYGIVYGESDGALGAATSTPTGSVTDSLATASASAATYSNGTYNRDISLEMGLLEANVGNGVEVMMFYTWMGAYQIHFDPYVPKDNTKVWTFVTNLAWTRATIP